MKITDHHQKKNLIIYYLLIYNIKFTKKHFYSQVYSVLKSDIKPLVKSILTFHNAKNIREFRGYNEAAFQTAVELLIPSQFWLSEVRLINDCQKKKGL